MIGRTGRHSRRFILGGLLASAAQGALAEAPARSPRPVPRGPVPAAPVSAGAFEALIRDAGVSGRTVCAVADARSGALLEALDADVAMPPASVAKAVTALYALETLGPGHRFRTRLVAEGEFTGGVLKGDLVLQGSGDPTLSTDDLAGLAAALKATGLREVRGRLRVWDGALPYVRTIDPTQPAHVGYSPSVSGLNLNFNRVHFEWRRDGGDWRVAMDARSERYRPEVAVARMRVADRASPVFSYSERGGIDEWTVARAALGRDGSRWLPVRQPARYAGEVFAWFARAHGIDLGKPEVASGPPRGTVLAEHVSDDLRAIAAGMLRWSTNITAEALGLCASVQRGNAPPWLAASGDRMANWLQGRAGVRDARFVDHSGLGEDSRMTAEGMVRALVAAGPDGQLRGLLKKVDLLDSKGRPIKDHPARVAAKTGTLNFVSGLGGYMQTRSNRVLAFAIFSADAERRDRLAPEQRERPPGGRAWLNRARGLQQELLWRWAELYDG